MARFLQDIDYTALIRDEIKTVLLENYTEAKLLTAEKMAIGQIRNYLKSRYDLEAIFTGYDPLPDPDPRDYYIIMISIDCTLYHLYSSLAPNRIPEHRSQRYGDAIKWLIDAGRGNVTADLPLLTVDGEIKSPVRIKSKHPLENHKW